MPFAANSIAAIINEARSNSSELPWIEFKTNNADPQTIGEYVSAMSNTAALFGKAHAFLIWGIDDVTHDVIGTDFKYDKRKVGQQALELWISTQLQPQVQIYFHDTTIDGKHVVLLEISPAFAEPVKFKGVDYIRIDSHKKKLKDFPDTERELWAIFTRKPFESMIALENVPGELVLRYLDYPSYFDLLSLDIPSTKDSILEQLLTEKLIVKDEAGAFNITNLGAILFARRLSDFPSLERKAIRVIKYTGNNRIAGASREQIGGKGYANGFEGLINYINGLLPVNEVMGAALRKDVPTYPELAVREVVANAIIHQNFFLTGTSPVIEIFDNRMEITNPGIPLIDKERFVDHPPVSRNEMLASFMRRIGVCEERGSGFDKVVAQTEAFQLPAPEIELYDNSTRVTLFAHKTFSEMSREDRLRACYLHACLKRVNREYLTNASLRERFQIDVKNSSMISRLLNDACKSGLIKMVDETVGAKNRRYLPYWA